MSEVVGLSWELLFPFCSSKPSRCQAPDDEACVASLDQTPCGLTITTLVCCEASCTTSSTCPTRSWPMRWLGAELRRWGVRSWTDAGAVGSQGSVLRGFGVEG